MYPTRTEAALESPDALRRSVVVVDDERTFGELLAMALRAQEGLRCLAVEHGIDAAVAAVRQHRPDVVVMDVQFAGDDRDGIDATALILACSPGTKVVLLTGYADRSVVRRAAEAGACSVMPKDGSLPDLLSAVENAGTGGLVVHPGLLKMIMTESVDVPLQRPRLSSREHDVLGMLAVGMDARAIARQLHISLNTCRGYIKTLLSKLQAHSQLEAVAIARRAGLLDGDPALPR
jgi:DNA-binding NarL/FixJ family response regulator